MARRHNLRRLRSNWYYTAVELSKALNVHLTTVRVWRMQGLERVLGTWPHLFHGEAVKAFLAARAKPHKPLAPGELFCIACKAPRFPRDNRLKLVDRSATTVDFSGPCGTCGHLLYRRARRAEIADKLGPCTIAYEDEQTTVSGSHNPVQMSLFADAAK